MPNSVLTFFENIGSWFKKVFKQLPAWNVIALSTLNLIAPLAETVISFVDPALATVATPIITQIQADLGTASQLVAAGNSGGLAGVLQSVQSNLNTLLSEGHITDPASVEKAKAAVTTITSEIQAIIAAVPAAA